VVKAGCHRGAETQRKVWDIPGLFMCIVRKRANEKWLKYQIVISKDQF